MVNKKKIHYSCEVGIEKSVPRDHRLSSLDKPPDANWRSSGQIFYSTLALMMDSYFVLYLLDSQAVFHITSHVLVIFKFQILCIIKST